MDPKKISTIHETILHSSNKILNALPTIIESLFENYSTSFTRSTYFCLIPCVHNYLRLFLFFRCQYPYPPSFAPLGVGRKHVTRSSNPKSLNPNPKNLKFKNPTTVSGCHVQNPNLVRVNQVVYPRTRTARKTRNVQNQPKNKFNSA